MLWSFLCSVSSVKMRVIIRLLILVELMFKLSFCNDLQNTSQETVDWATRTHLTKQELTWVLRAVRSFVVASTSCKRRVTHVKYSMKKGMDLATTNGIYTSVTQTVNQVIMATAKLSKWQLNLWFWSFYDGSNPQLSRKYWYEYKLWNIIPRYQLRDILNRPSLSKRMYEVDLAVFELWYPF